MEAVNPSKFLSMLFDANARRQRQLVALNERCRQLEAEHAAAVTADDDAAADRAWTKLEKANAEVRGLKATMATAERLKGEQQAAAAAEARQAQLAEVQDSEARVMLAGEKFEQFALAVAPAWNAYVAAMAEHRAMAGKYGLRAGVPGGIAPGEVWSRVWFQFTSAVQPKDGAPLMLPQSGSKSRHVRSVADCFKAHRNDPDNTVFPTPEGA